MPNLRFCPSCGLLQEWCDDPRCDGPIPRGHWSHLTIDESLGCMNLGDRNPDPAGPPDFTWMEAYRA